MRKRKITIKTTEEIDELAKKNISEWLKPLGKRKKAIISHYEEYKKSGILYDIRKYLREKYQIPNLNPTSDIDEVKMMGDENIDDQNKEKVYSRWLRESGFEEKIHKDLWNFIKLSKLPRNSFAWLMHWVLYKEELGPYPVYGINDLIFDILEGNTVLNEYSGYTKSEARFLIDECKETLNRNNYISEELKEKLLNSFSEVISKYDRKIRPISNPSLNAKIIKAYKNKKRTSQYIVQSLAGDTDLSIKVANRKAAAIRKRMERLRKKLPFLSNSSTTR